VLKHQEASLVLSANHERIETGLGDAATILTTNVDKERPRAVPVLVTRPISLLVRTVIEEVEMVDHVIENALFELGHINRRTFLSLGQGCKHHTGSETSHSSFLI